MSPSDVKGFVEQASPRGWLDARLTTKFPVDIFATKLVFFDIRNFSKAEDTSVRRC